jgi:3-deoxy-7-phosphoheptulonate synthase
MPQWTVDSWTAFPSAMPIRYDDPAELEVALTRLRSMPPLVTSWEIERLKREIADAQAGRRFLLQGGDCAESLADCRPDVIAAKLKILLQMSLVLVQGALKPVIRVGRFAGQYAKPRSSPVERRVDTSGERELPSYFGDLINRADFDDDSRRPDPALMLAGYQHAAVTLNFIRSLSEGGFADLHHPEYWDLSFMHRAGIAPHLKDEYTRLTEQVADALRFMEALGEGAVEDLSRVRFYTSHEGLNLHYESAQTRSVPRRDGYYDLTTHLPWIGERTRQPTSSFFVVSRTRWVSSSARAPRPTRSSGSASDSTRRTNQASSFSSRAWAQPTSRHACRRSSTPYRRRSSASCGCVIPCTATRAPRPRA